LRFSSLAVVAAISVSISGCAARPAEDPPGPDTSRPIELSVDASDPGRALFHAHLVVPARAGAMTLAYPQWIPGTHRPEGPVVNVVDLHVTAGGRALAWRRDPERMYEIAVTVPPGATTVDVDFDYVNAVGPVTSQGDSTTANALIVEWNRLVMYPRGPAVSTIPVTAHLKLPAGWSYGSALEASTAGSAAVDFRTVSLETLVDSPVIAGRYAHTFDLGTVRGARHAVTVVAETAAEAEVKPEIVDGWRRMVVEANALFGARHYDSYRFLVVLSDEMEGGWAGLEHHQSSLEGLKERGLLDDDQRMLRADLLPHEYLHSWDGKYRRPRGIATPDYQTPMQDELLWVYEGLTQYLGLVVTARAGMATLDDSRAWLARWAANAEAPVRSWRPLVDTAVASQILRETPTRGSWRRGGQDYYQEGALIWLEADALIRQRTRGARSLDDFCQRFFGGKDSGAMVRPYDLDEVVTTLNGVYAYDWRTFFDTRIYQVAPRPPTGGLETAGYRLAYVADKPDLTKKIEAFVERATYSDSLGFSVKNEGNTVLDVRPGSPADAAGLVSGTSVVAVDGRKYEPQVMKDALARAKSSPEPIELLVSKDDRFRTVKVDWHGGERYRTLERDPGKPDLLEKILAPRAKVGGAK
jgi:predicted metalloprotease with PDZ domain